MSQPAHSHGIDSFAVTIATPMSWDTLSRVLAEISESSGRGLLRLKGLVEVCGVDRPVVVHGVQHVFYPPELLSSWPPGCHGTRIVLIAQAQKREELLAPFRKNNLQVEIV